MCKLSEVELMVGNRGPQLIFALVPTSRLIRPWKAFKPLSAPIRQIVTSRKSNWKTCKIKMNRDELINDLRVLSLQSPPLLSAASLFDTDLCSKANHIKCLFNDAAAEKHWAHLLFRWEVWSEMDDKEIEGTSVIHSKEALPRKDIYCMALREEREM